MSNYKNILLALDLSCNLDDVIRRACEFAQTHSAKLSILNVVEHLAIDPIPELSLPSPLTAEQELLKIADQRISKSIAAQPREATAGLVISHAILSGNIRDLVIQTAEDDGHDLIIIGRQQRHGLALMLGCTEDAVLHNASCDVLAITL